jgi:hypothetical protein
MPVSLLTILFRVDKRASCRDVLAPIKMKNKQYYGKMLRPKKMKGSTLVVAKLCTTILRSFLRNMCLYYKKLIIKVPIFFAFNNPFKKS